MFNIGDTILYSTTGICSIERIEEKDIGKIKKQYYVLKPVSKSNNTVFVPLDNETLTSKMRSVRTRSEIINCIRSCENLTDIWIEDDNERKEVFTKMLGLGELKELLILVCSLCMHRDIQLSSGKNFHIADSRILSDAQRLLFDEISFTLGIEIDEVPKVIESEISVKVI